MRNNKRQTSSYKKVPQPKLQMDAKAAVQHGWDNGDASAAFILKDGPGTGDVPSDLLERTALFGETIVRFAKRVPLHPVNNRLIDQLVGCGTSIGANYCEANEALSKRDFRHSISRCLKETKETRHFLRMVAASEPWLADEARSLYREASELRLIFGSMYQRNL